MSYIIKVMVGHGEQAEFVPHEAGGSYKTQEAAKIAIATLKKVGDGRTMIADHPKRGRPFGSRNIPKNEIEQVERITLSDRQVATLIASIKEKKRGSGEYEITLPIGAIVAK